MAQITAINAPDVLTDVLQTLHLQGRVFCSSQLSAPWALSLPASDFAHFHVIERGGAWLRLTGEKQWHAAASGDLLIVPHGQGHVLSDSPHTKPVPMLRLLKGSQAARHLMQHGGGGAPTQMLCGSFRFESRGQHPLLSVLPPLLHIKSGHGQMAEWLQMTLRLLTTEMQNSRPGSETLVTRLLDIIFVQALRTWIESLPPEQNGWLSALRDPKIGTALGLMHREPQRTWSVESLASEVAMSRSPFAARFTALVGEPPLAYLTGWRMHLAETLLMRDGLNVSEVAGRIGYESEAAFSKAFKRYFGQSPLAHRRQTQGTPTTNPLRAEAVRRASAKAAM
jgi:AraC-like DNA-binding protein